MAKPAACMDRHAVAALVHGAGRRHRRQVWVAATALGTTSASLWSILAGPKCWACAPLAFGASIALLMCVATVLSASEPWVEEEGRHWQDPAKTAFLAAAILLQAVASAAGTLILVTVLDRAGAAPLAWPTTIPLGVALMSGTIAASCALAQAERLEVSRSQALSMPDETSSRTF